MHQVEEQLVNLQQIEQMRAQQHRQHMLSRRAFNLTINPAVRRRRVVFAANAIACPWAFPLQLEGLPPPRIMKFKKAPRREPLRLTEQTNTSGDPTTAKSPGQLEG